MADTDAQATEKPNKESGGSDTAIADQGTNTSSPDHEVVHADEHSVDVAVHKVSGSQKRLWFMVIVAAILLAFGGVMLFLQLESNPLTEGGDSSLIFNETPEEEAGPSGPYVYVYDGSGQLATHRIEDATEETRSVAGAPTDFGGLSPDFQISSDGDRTAVRTALDSIEIRNGEDVKTITQAGISEWALIPDGSKVYLAAGSQLVQYDTRSGESVVVDEAYSPGGSSQSQLHAGRDGLIRQYGRSGTELYEAIYSPAANETSSRTLTIKRLEQISSFISGGLSPDGSTMLFTANIEGNQTLQLLSLNSFVLRTVFVAEVPGGFPAEFAWSDDSNNVAINVSGNGTVRLVNLKVGTLEKQVVLEENGSGSRFNSLSWSPDKSRISYVQDGVLKIVTTSDGTISNSLTGVDSMAATGWFE